MSANLTRLNTLSRQLVPAVPLPKDERKRTLAIFYDAGRSSIMRCCGAREIDTHRP